jgi:1-deoxy-D-xylulose-5-phosphate synthase
VTIEENVLAGGFGSAVLELLSRRGFRGEAFCLGIPDCFVPHGARELLYKSYVLDAKGIVDHVQSRGW